MAFFGNDAVNRVNFHSGVHAVAAGAGGVFFFAYLLHAGVSVPMTLAAFAAIVAGRFCLRPLILPLGKRFGLKPLVIAGALLAACQYPLLAEVHGLDGWLLALCAVSSLSDTLYWPSYHAYFAALGDAEHRGQQIAVREAISAIVGIVAPLVGAWALVTGGPRITFAAVALVQALSALPLLGAPNVRVAPRAPGLVRAASRGFALFVTDGWMGACFYYVWQVSLFISLSRSLTGYGGAMALAALVGAITGLLIGRHIDKGGGRRAVVLAYAATAGLALLRALSVGSPWLAVAANAPGPFVAALLLPAEMTAVYNLAKASPCPFRFHILTEGGWDVGAASGALIAAGLGALGQSLAISMVLTIPGAAVGAWVLWRYYGANPGAVSVDVPIELLTEPPHPP
ncbi:MAG TPA: MFS transporter [Caulobacteraceae bacterium]|nr:MFS transporter [Caulobacteraceae bacterium]